MKNRFLLNFLTFVIITICGGLFAFTFFGFFKNNLEQTGIIKWAAICIFTIIGMFLSAWILRITNRELDILPIKQRFQWAAGCLLFGCMLSFIIPNHSQILRTDHLLRITATGERNPISKGSQVFLNKIMGFGSFRAADFNRICKRVEKQGWEPFEENLAMLGDQPAEFVCEFSSASQVFGLRFGQHDWSGYVKVRLDEQSPNTQDLFSNTSKYKDIFISYQITPRQRMIFTMFRIGLGIWLGLIFFLASAATGKREADRLTGDPTLKREILSKWALQLLVWSILLAAGLIVLRGRYDWEANPLYARIGYTCSAYFFLLFTPTLFGLLRTFVSNVWVARIATGIWWIIATLPYQWLGLDKYYYSFEPYDFNTAPVPSRPEWFPQAFKSLPVIPHEFELFIGLAVIGLIVCILIIRRRPNLKKLALLGFLAFAVILLETWFHLSLRAPYTYSIHLIKPDAPRWFISYMFPNLMGAVNADLPVFRSLDLLFMGKPFWSDMLLRRSFYFYLTSQFSYFVNLYYVGLIYNILLWTISAFCGYLFTRRYWSERTAILTAGFIATGRLFIFFAASPYTYLAQYAGIMILIYLFERFIVEGETRIGNVMLFSGILGLFSLTYDMFPFYFFLLGYGILSRVSWKTLLAVFLITLTIYAGFIILYAHGLGIPMATDNSQLGTSALRGWYHLIRSGDLNQWTSLIRSFISEFVKMQWENFFTLPLAFALLGLYFNRGRKQSAIPLLIILPALALQGLLQFGGSWIYSLPRLYFITYPGIFILAAVFLDQISLRIEGAGFTRVGHALPWATLAVVFVMNNLDVWGIRMY